MSSFWSTQPKAGVSQPCCFYFVVQLSSCVFMAVCCSFVPTRRGTSLVGGRGSGDLPQWLAFLSPTVPALRLLIFFCCLCVMWVLRFSCVVQLSDFLQTSRSYKNVLWLHSWCFAAFKNTPNVHSPAHHFTPGQQIRMDKLIACSCGCHLFGFFQQTEGGRANSSPSDDSLGRRRRSRRWKGSSMN